jgi:phosphopantetheinyl transferase
VASLGSSNILTDCQGNLVQHYEYTAFGKERFEDNTQAFNVSHRYTGQIT